MSSPFENAFTQRVDKVSTALNEGNAGEVAFQIRGMVEDDPLQAMRLIRDAERTTSPGAIDHITRDRAGDVFIVDNATGERTFAGQLGSHGQMPEAMDQFPPANVGDQCIAPPPPPPFNDAPVYGVPEWHHPRWFAPRPEYELPPSFVFNGNPRPYYGFRDTWNVGYRNRDYINFHVRF
jgi:hypothetical protein